MATKEQLEKQVEVLTVELEECKNNPCSSLSVTDVLKQTVSTSLSVTSNSLKVVDSTVNQLGTVVDEALKATEETVGAITDTAKFTRSVMNLGFAAVQETMLEYAVEVETRKKDFKDSLISKGYTEEEVQSILAKYRLD